MCATPARSRRRSTRTPCAARRGRSRQPACRRSPSASSTASCGPITSSARSPSCARSCRTPSSRPATRSRRSSASSSGCRQWSLNAYLGPVMAGYIRRLGPRLQALGMTAAPHLTQSNGGVIGFATAAAVPVRTILSGPSTGVVGAQALGALAGFDDLITFDMGGTSTDVALLQEGHCRLAAEATVHGYPIKAPMLDIHTVGAGGGSIAYIDSGGLSEGGPALLRRRSRPRLLRQGQRGARRHRRQRRAADAQSRAPAGRAHEDPPGSRRAGDRSAGRSGLASASRRRRRASCRS